MRRGLPGLLARARGTAALAVLAAAVLLAGPAVASTADGSAFSPPAGAYLGASLDWSSDSAAEQADRLGRPAALLEHVASVPVTEAEVGYLAQFLRQAEAEGALAAVTLRPVGGLDGFDREEAEAAVDALSRARDGRDLPLFVRFAPEMNASWTAWGFAPDEYTAAFRVFAEVLHSDLPDAVAVWSPAAGESYPFSSGGATGDPALDTDGSGSLDGGDDPYGPYYPGDDAVDWVGLSAYHDPSGGGAPTNAIAAEGALEADLDGEGDLAFYQRFAASTGTPMMLETAAFYSPGAGGPGELEIKQDWWRQVITATSGDEHPLIDVVLWRDSSSARAVVGEVVIDWSLTGSDAVARAFAADAEQSELVFGPVYTPSTSSSAAPSGEGRSPARRPGSWSRGSSPRRSR
ncbi:hypothetical protein Q0F99_11030 [Rathayibacter oskolensis]|uniref:hypothetical protein n=1 Tax=Rathayibacter oskolensis TaxID=1891671 RepID=UPI00265E2D84|nr:hypothetical protein [Rathayibacter oskolensis]WKK70414.1 hypothetical protein Q0F99_11030 [Rathayibacter oskolensis]